MPASLSRFMSRPSCAPMGQLWEKTQRPDLHRRSALRFWSHDPRSLILEGSGYWRYVPSVDGVRFLTSYDYRTRFGRRPCDRPAPLSTAARLGYGLELRPAAAVAGGRNRARGVARRPSPRARVTNPPGTPLRLPRLLRGRAPSLRRPRSPRTSEAAPRRAARVTSPGPVLFGSAPQRPRRFVRSAISSRPSASGAALSLGRGPAAPVGKRRHHVKFVPSPTWAPNLPSIAAPARARAKTKDVRESRILFPSAVENLKPQDARVWRILPRPFG